MAFIDRMRGQDYIDKTREYLDYLEDHLNNVKRAFNEVSKACEGMAWVVDDYTWNTLRGEIINHDLSKFSNAEFNQYRKSFYPADPNEKESSGMDAAWENHKKNNHHHHETAKNYHDIVHMVIDWTAMGYKFGDTAQEYYESNKNQIKLSDEHISFMYEIFNHINRSPNGT